MEKSDEFIIQPFIDQGFGGLVELNETAYPGRDISNQEYLGWEYIKNPDGLALITVGMSDTKIVSQYIVLPRTFSIDNKLVKGSLSVNTLTHPDFRGHDLFRKLANETFTRCIDKNISFTIGFPNPVSQPIIERKKVFDTIGNLPLLFIPFNPFSSLIRFVLNRRDKSGAEIEMNQSAIALFPSGGVSFFDFKEDSGKYEKFLQKFNSEKHNVTNRTIQFLRWRYVTIPRRKYCIFKIEIKNEIKGLIVFRSKFIYGLRCGIIIDFMLTDEISDAKSLLNLVKTFAKENKLDLIFTTVPVHSKEFGILKEAGFYSMPKFLQPQKLTLIYKKHISSTPDQLSDFRKWFLTFGDYDIF